MYLDSVTTIQLDDLKIANMYKNQLLFGPNIFAYIGKNDVVIRDVHLKFNKII